MQASAELANGGVAFGAPGIEPRWTSSNKVAVGCAHSTSSRVWFSCSHGLINEIYYPTIDGPQTHDLQTHKDSGAKDSGLGIWYADIKVTKSQKAPARFGFLWLDSGQ